MQIRPIRVLTVAMLVLCGGCHPPRDRAADHPSLRREIDAQARIVEAFFAEPIEQPYEVCIAASRSQLIQIASDRWGATDLPCWAVAMGTGTALVLLDPATWDTEACEHDASDTLATSRIIVHELVHVFHGQHRNDTEFNDVDDASWFAEGLAVLASGQLDEQRERQAREVVRSGRGPTQLAQAWSGPARYAISGTMVRFIDRRLGREGLKTLLPLSTNGEILQLLDMTEAEFLVAWQASLLGP